MERYDRYAIAFAVVFFILMASVMPYFSCRPDEGTHALLALFYHDLISSADSLSFGDAYDFGISYLAHYPKLQVFYPPLYHLTAGLIFYPLFGASLFSAKLCHLMFASLAILAFYFLSKKFCGRKASFLSMLMFAMYPTTLIYANQAMMDYSSFLFAVLAVFFYVRSDSPKNQPAVALFSFLALMGKRLAFFLPIVFSLHLLSEKKYRPFLVYSAACTLLSAPYLYVMSKIGGLSASETIFETYVGGKFFGYLSNAFSFSLFWPAIFAIVGIFLIHVFRKQSDWKFFSVWFAVPFFSFLLIDFTNRFFPYFLMPCFIAAGIFVSGLPKNLQALFVAFLVLSTVSSLSTEVRPSQDIPKIVSEIYSGEKGNVAMFSERHDLYSSAFMFEFALLDRNKTLFFYRPCAFFNMSEDELLATLSSSGVRYIIAVPGEPGYENVERISSDLRLIRDSPIEVYEFLPYSEQEGYCNFVCLTKEKICTGYESPFDVYGT